ncbi:hypothetical protein ACFYRK_23560 [Streptomyces sp. NPDC005381]|uniref:hypothetical protein n=1 Tax=Streptomyces sp. NPDC005381 TaxID=3364714 RepID=UPI0036A50B5B
MTRILAALRTALAGAHVKDLGDLHPPLTELAATGLQTPDIAEGHRLAAALRAYVAPAPAGASEAPSVAAPAPEAAADARVAEDADEERRDDDDGLVPGDEQDEPEGAIFPALRILKESVARSKMHPILVIRTEDREAGPCPEPCCVRLVLRPASLTTTGLAHCLSSPAHAHSRTLDATADAWQIRGMSPERNGVDDQLAKLFRDQPTQAIWIHYPPPLRPILTGTPVKIGRMRAVR